MWIRIPRERYKPASSSTMFARPSGVRRATALMTLSLIGSFPATLIEFYEFDKNPARALIATLIFYCFVALLPIGVFKGYRWGRIIWVGMVASSVFGMAGILTESARLLWKGDPAGLDGLFWVGAPLLSAMLLVTPPVNYWFRLRRKRKRRLKRFRKARALISRSDKKASRRR